MEFLQAAASNSGSWSLSARNANSTSLLTVRGMPLDLVVERHGLSRIDLIKMDVEGAELRALGGMRKTIAKFWPKGITELRPELLLAMGASIEEVEAYFCEAGYLSRRQIDEADLYGCRIRHGRAVIGN